MRHRDVRSKYKLSTTAIEKLLTLGIITKDELKEYSTPWDEVQLFRPTDVAGFLSRHSGKHWSIDNIMYVYKALFFDLHRGGSDRALYRITINDFHSLVESISSDLEIIWKKSFGFLLQ